MAEPGGSDRIRVVYIMGLSRCGSTILQFLLASHPRAVGIGEVEHTIRRYGPAPQVEAPRPCSCGQAPEACPAWSPVLPELGALPPQRAHTRIVEHFAENYPGRALIDNSKTRRGLALYLSSGLDLDLRVIYVVRDFRGWSVSTVRGLRKRDPRKPYIAPPGPLAAGYMWLVSNAKGLAMLARRRVPSLVVSYDRLVHDVDRQMARVGQFVGLDTPPGGLDLSAAVHHDLFGNPMKQDADRNARVVYSDDWKTAWRPGWAAPLLIPVYAANAAAHRAGRGRGA